MKTQQLVEETIEINNIFLDPNNPRFWSQKNTRDIPEHKIKEQDVQTRALAEIEKYGLAELKNSILRNGFLPMDRIVIRVIKDDPISYVVVEGNRRVASLKSLRDDIDNDNIDEEHIDDEYLENLKKETNELKVLVYKGDDTHDIAWLLQGIRHISGIRDWSPAQRARLVADQIEKEKLKFREAGQKFGLSAQAVGRLYRSFKALEQMRSHDEYQSYAKNEYFTLFEESIRNKDVKKWLSWDDENYQFTENDNLTQFYSWIIPDDEHDDNKRRVHDPRQIKKLGFIIAQGKKDLINLIDQHEISIDAAFDRANESSTKKAWTENLDKADYLINDIPAVAITDHSTELAAHLEKISSSIEKWKKMIQASQE